MFVNTFFLEIKNLEFCKILFLPLIYLNLFARRNFRESIKLVYFARMYCRKHKDFTRYFWIPSDTVAAVYFPCYVFCIRKYLRSINQAFENGIKLAQLIFTCSKSTIETLEKGKDMFKVNNSNNNSNTGQRCSGVCIVNFEHFASCSTVSIVNFEHVIASWVGPSQTYMMEFLVNYTYG